MKESETDYLNKLFASSSDVTDEVEVEIPLLDVPETLSDKLHSIADAQTEEQRPANVVPLKTSVFKRWPKISSIAAGLLVAIMGLQFYQQQQTLKQLEQAQSDLATALHYLGEANRIAQNQVRDSFKENINKAGVVPAMEIGREALRPKSKRRDSNVKLYQRTL